MRVDPLASVVAAGFGVLAVVIHLGFQRVAQAVAGTSSSACSPNEPAPAPHDSALMDRDREIRINERAQDALGAQHEQYLKACWHPKAPMPGSAPDLGAALVVSLSFDAMGLETRREITPAGSPSNAAILACARAQSLPRLQIPTQGTAASTVVGLSIP